MRTASTTPLPPAVIEIIAEEASKWDTTLTEILNGCRMSHVVCAKAAIIKRLRERPSLPSDRAIGKWLNMHSSSISTLVRRKDT